MPPDIFNGLVRIGYQTQVTLHSLRRTKPEAPKAWPSFSAGYLARHARHSMIEIRKGDVFRAYPGAPINCAREDARRVVSEKTGKAATGVRTLGQFLQPGDYD